MATKRLILTNTLYQLLAKIVSTVSTLIVTVFIARLLGVQTWGDYSIVISYVTLFYLFTEFGLNSIAAREFSTKSKIESKDFTSFFLLKFVLTLCVSLLSLLILNFFDYSQNVVQAIIFGQINLILFSLASSFNALFQAKLNYKYLFYSTFGFGVVYLSSFLLVFPRYNGNLILLLVPLTLGEITRFGMSFYYAKKLIVDPLSFGINKKYINMLVITSLPLAGVLFFNTLMIQVDRIMLSVMVPSVYLGYYSLSYKLFDVLLVLPTFFMNAAFPVFTKRYKEKGNYNKEFSQSLFFMVFVGLFVTAVSLLCGWLLIPLIWGVQMSPAVISFNILMVGSVLFYLSSLVSWSFVVENKQKILIYVYALGFLVNLVLNYFVIQKFNYVGAAFTTILTELLIVILLEILRRKYLTVRTQKVDLKSIVPSVWKIN